ncbi:MAG: NAD(P)/FAD-dependent oxidoreductase [Actinomycetota bacterium]
MTLTDLRFDPGVEHRDVVVVGARCAGSATAMLLARAGIDVLVVDRSPPGADTLSTHALLRPGVQLLARWGLLDAVRDAGTPPVHRTVFHYDDQTIEVPIKADGEVDALYAPRRTVIDPILADAAAASGAEIRFGTQVVGLIRDGFRVAGVVVDDGAGRREIRARTVIGADGVRSLVARTVGAPVEHRAQRHRAYAMHYVDGVAEDAYEYWFTSDDVDFGVMPTNDHRAVVFLDVTPERFATDLRPDVPGGFVRLLEQSCPALADRVAGRPRLRPRTFPGVHGFTRTPAGPGWALVGDAGCFTDPMSQHGMTSAFRDAELLAEQVLAVRRSLRSESAAGRAYRRSRDRIAIPLIDAVDGALGTGGDLVAIQRAHLEAASLIRSESRELSGRLVEELAS